jgi:hypothetical protein
MNVKNEHLRSLHTQGWHTSEVSQISVTGYNHWYGQIVDNYHFQYNSSHYSD